MRDLLQTQINNLNAERQELYRAVQRLETTITELRAEVIIKDDLRNEVDDARQQLDLMFKEKAKLQTELEAAFQFIQELEQKYLHSEQSRLDILRQLKECEFDLEAAMMEIQTLKQYIIDLKSRIAVYIPVKGDSIDKRLAEYINNFPDR